MVRRNAGFSEGHVVAIVALVALPVGFAAWLGAGVAAGAIYGIVLGLLTLVAVPSRMHVELGFLTAVISALVIGGGCLVATRLGFDSFRSLTIACAVLALVFIAMGVTIRVHDRRRSIE